MALVDTEAEGLKHDPEKENQPTEPEPDPEIQKTVVILISLTFRGGKPECSTTIPESSTMSTHHQGWLKWFHLNV